MEEHELIRVTIKDRVAVLAIDHPPVNALDAATVAQLSAAVDRVLGDDAVKVVIITGTDESFIAGADVREIAALSGADGAREMARVGHALLRKIEQASKPFIAAVNGRFCLGGGNEVALACHIRVAEESAKFGQTEIRLGLIPGWGATQRLTRLVGAGKAMELILTGTPIRAEEAHRLGLVNTVVPEGSALHEALRMGRRIAALSSVAVSKALDAIRAGFVMGYEEALTNEIERFSEMADTYDMREGVSAFLEKRTPRFEDR